MIIGAGRSGIAAARFLSENGAKKIYLCDTRKYDALQKDGFGIETVKNFAAVTTVLGCRPEEDTIRECDLLILSPGVPPDAYPCVIAGENGIKIMSEIEFAYSFFKGRVAAVTGTNGKTTTTTLLGELFGNAGFETYVGGNIGDPFINYAKQAGKDSVIALEISSFQLSLCEAMKPKVAIITNITPDHLDRHKTFDHYVCVKAEVFKNMDMSDTLILNMDDETVRALTPRAKCDIKYFTLTDNAAADAYFKDDQIIINMGEPVALIDKRALKLMGMHNVANVMCASLAALVMGADIEKIRETLKVFTPVEHRVEFVAEKKGVMYINDSKGTNPDASITAINAIDRPIILIMGGYDKKSSFDEIMELIVRKVKYVVILGATKQKIAKTADAYGYKSYTLADDYEQAVAICANIAEEGDCVLLSPASASWDMFDNYETRGRVFKELVNKIK